MRVIEDGPRHAVVQCQVNGSADLAASTLIDVSTLSGGPADVKVRRITASLSGFSAVLAWGATVPSDFQTIPAENPLCVDYPGLANDAGAGKTGDIVITTSGLAAGASGTITLHLTK